MDVIAFVYAFLSAVLMGTIGVFSKLTGLPAEIITFFRLIFGAGFMLLFLTLIRKTHLVKGWPSWPVLINGVLLAGFIIFYVQAMNYTSMANAIMLVYLAPLVASVIAHFFLGERLTFSALALICLALFGFGMMLEFKIEISRESREFVGICYGLLATASYAGFILINRLISQKIHVYTRTFWQLFTGGVVMLPFVMFSIHEVSIHDIPWLLTVGFFPGFLAIFFAVAALSRLPVALFGTIAYFEPVAVVIFGWTIFHESLHPMQISGCGLILFSGIFKTMMVGRQSS
ncbi:DMT family transporter [Desulfogranum japonicum]|uniref:DMT family transporter n=1 Tax=Desulfogranum japonicum TaxID=231447 RepID=UPI00048E1489|nr:DMT family transporter [Desulfogranum japonicum]